MAEYYKNFQKNNNPTSDTITKRSYTNQLKASERGDSIVSPDTEAQSQADVDAMSIRDRLWDAANFAYQQQRKESDRSFDQAQSQFNNQLIGRGMQRSSYGAGINANLANKRIEAQNQIYGQQIADYENRLMQVEQQEEATRQFNAQMGNNWLQQIIAKGGTPSDALLAQIGLGRADYNAMAQQIDAGGGGGWAGGSSGGGRGSGNGNNNNNNNKNNQNNLQAQANAEVQKLAANIITRETNEQQKSVGGYASTGIGTNPIDIISNKVVRPAASQQKYTKTKGS